MFQNQIGKFSEISVIGKRVKLSAPRFSPLAPGLPFPRLRWLPGTGWDRARAQGTLCCVFRKDTRGSKGEECDGNPGHATVQALGQRGDRGTLQPLRSLNT